MSIEVTRLDCVRGASIESATAAIGELLGSRGLARVPPDGPAGEAPRRLALYVDRGWLVVVDEDRLSDDPCWAAELSRALGGAAVTMTAYSDFDSLTLVRFESGREVGRMTIDEDTPREDDEWLPVKVPFLADIAPEGSRRSLEGGLEVGTSASEIALAIAEAAGLPRPLGNYDLPPAQAIELTFTRDDTVVEKTADETLPRASPRLRSERERKPKPSPHADPAADELAAFASFLGGLEEKAPSAAEARPAHTPVRERPPLPGRMEDDAAFDNYLGRGWAVGRAQWDGDFAALGDELFAIAIELADGFVANFGDDVIGVELRPQGRSTPVRVGGPLAASTSGRGSAIWEKVRPHFAGGASLRFRSADFHLEHTVRAPGPTIYDPCPVVLAWSVPLPPYEPMVRALSSCFDSVIRRCARSPHVVEAVVVAQERPGELAYPRMAGLWRTERQWWRDHVASPGWRVFVPAAAARKLRDRPVDGIVLDEVPSGLVVASKAASPFEASVDEMNRLASHLLPAIGTKAERDALHTSPR